MAYYSHMEQPYTPDPFKNFTPRPNAQTAIVTAPSDPQSPIDPATLAALEGMTKAELVGLIRRCCPEKARVLMMTEDQQGQAMVDMLAITALTGTDRREARECGKEWMDRIKGKPVQRQIAAVAVAEGKFSIADILASIDGTSAGLPVIED